MYHKLVVPKIREIFYYIVNFLTYIFSIKIPSSERIFKLSTRDSQEHMISIINPHLVDPYSKCFFVFQKLSKLLSNNNLTQVIFWAKQKMVRIYHMEATVIIMITNINPFNPVISVGFPSQFHTFFHSNWWSGFQFCDKFCLLIYFCQFHRKYIQFDFGALKFIFVLLNFIFRDSILLLSNLICFCSDNFDISPSNFTEWHINSPQALF